MESASKDGLVIVNVGGTGSGKTYFTRMLLSVLKASGKRFYIHDIDGEYTDFYSSAFEPIKKFFNRVLKTLNSVIVFEEAVLVFKHFGQSDEILELLVGARRRKNVIIFNFHSMRQVPVWILTYCDRIVIRHTSFDSVERFEKDYPHIVEIYHNVQRSADRYFYEEINLRPEKT